MQGIISFILAYKSEIEALDSCLNLRDNEETAQWKAPMEDIVKVNFDASYIAQTS